jgi:CheY-like chemotaxis protein/signal transduction histidine kinase
MSAETGDPRPTTSLLDALADPAVVVDSHGRISAWNEAAAARFGLDGGAVGAEPDELLRRWRGGARRVALAGDGGALVVYAVDDDGLGPDEIALTKADIVGRAAGSALHELNNALNLGIGLGGLIAMEAGLPGDLRGMAQDLERYGQRAQQLARTFLDFSRSQPKQTAAVRIGPLVRETVDVLGHATVNMEHRVTAPDLLPDVEADPATLRLALFAVLVNALEAQGVVWTPGAPSAPGRLVVTASARDDARGRRVRVAVEDGAAPVPDHERPGLFTGGAARSTRDLSVARTLVTGLGGRISHEIVADGNRIVIELPVAGGALPAELPEEPEPASRPVVLVCDDDVFIRSLLIRMMERRGFEAIEARGGQEAVDILATRDVALVIADQHMPGLDGAALYELAVERRPSLATRFILTTGDPRDAVVTEFAARAGVPVLAKPFDNAELDALTRRALEA